MKSVKHYPFIDAVRGYAILLVLATHASQFVAPTGQGWRAALALGAGGVQLFYVASALTLCLSWHSRRMEESAPLRNFFIRRFFRIAPLFYLAIPVYLLLDGCAPRHWAPNGVQWWYVPLTVLFLNGFDPETIDSVVPGGWSVAVEMNFYLLLPFLLGSVTTLRRAWLGVATSLLIYLLSRVLFSALLAGTYPVTQRYLVANFLVLNIVGQLPVFMLGIAAYFAFLDLARWRRLVWTLDGLVLLTLVSVAGRSGPAAALLANQVFAGCVGSLLALSLALYPGGPLTGSAIRWIGHVSFSLYLVHYAVLTLLARAGVDEWMQSALPAPAAIHFFLLLAISLPLACACHDLIERRGVAAGRRLIARLEPRLPLLRET